MKKTSSFLCLMFMTFQVSAQSPTDAINTEVLLNPEEVVEDAAPVELEPDTDASEQVEEVDSPEEIVEEAFPVEVPDAESTGVLQMTEEEQRSWIDSTRDWLYGKSHGTVEWLDTGIVEHEDPVPTPPSRFRVGLYTQIDLEENGEIKFAPVADFDADVELPNLEERMKLFISTKDPTALPGQDPFDSDNALRVGASRSLFDNWKTSAGIKTKWPPEPFVYLQWSPEYSLGRNWTVVPQIRPFWESQDGFGGMTSAVFNRWNNRTMLRQSFSLRWTQEQADEDDKAEVNEDSSQFGYNGGGYRWDSTTVLAYVPLLLDERDYGRRVNGEDIARGFGVKGRVTGNEVNSTKATVTLFYKNPAYKDFLYFILAPEVVWSEENNWNEEYVLKAGFEMLLWGDDPIK